METNYIWLKHKRTIFYFSSRGAFQTVRFNCFYLTQTPNRMTAWVVAKDEVGRYVSIGGPQIHIEMLENNG